MSKHIAARYPGRCLACDDAIEVGDDLAQDADGTWVHATCATSTRVNLFYTAPEVICEGCHLVKPCGCDED